MNGIYGTGNQVSCNHVEVDRISAQQERARAVSQSFQVVHHHNFLCTFLDTLGDACIVSHYFLSISLNVHNLHTRLFLAVLVLCSPDPVCALYHKPGNIRIYSVDAVALFYNLNNSVRPCELLCWDQHYKSLILLAIPPDPQLLFCPTSNRSAGAPYYSDI